MADRDGAKHEHDDENAEAPFDAVTDEEKALRQKVKDFRREVQHAARKHIHETMPTKIMLLDKLFHSLSRTPPAGDAPVVDPIDAAAHAPAAAAPAAPAAGAGKKRKHGEADAPPAPAAAVAAAAAAAAAVPPGAVVGEGGRLVYPHHVPAQRDIAPLTAVLRAEAQDLIELCNTVKISIQLHIPKIESGGDFGVHIQEETVSDVLRAEDSAYAMLDTIIKYHSLRAKLATKVIKYPNVEDYKLGVAAIDFKEHINLRMCTADLRNAYATMYDIIIKNLDRLKKPRTSHSSSMF